MAISTTESTVPDRMMTRTSRLPTLSGTVRLATGDFRSRRNFSRCSRCFAISRHRPAAPHPPSPAETVIHNVKCRSGRIAGSAPSNRQNLPRRCAMRAQPTGASGAKLIKVKLDRRICSRLGARMVDAGREQAPACFVPEIVSALAHLAPTQGRRVSSISGEKLKRAMLARSPSSSKVKM